MTKSPPKNGNPWSDADVKQLKQLAKENTPTRVIALKAGRTPGAVQPKALDISAPLNPTNPGPYNRRPKA